MKANNIMDIINLAFEDHDTELSEKIKDVPGYNESQKIYSETIHSLEKETMFKIDNAAVRMETISRDVAVNEGFKLAVRLIFSALID